MSNIERAVDVIGSIEWQDYDGYQPRRHLAQVLADAGLLVTDELQTVIDAVLEWKFGDLPPGDAMIDMQLRRVKQIDYAVDAYLAARKVKK